MASKFSMICHRVYLYKINTIHSSSNRSEAPFITQNCASIPSTLIESILFGTTKGSFTGAIDKIGIFEAANKGTIFLDEINSLSLELQSKLLRTLETQEIRRVGSIESISLNIRIIASTNEDLFSKVAKGEFRKDLFYRLNTTSFNVPPLRKRPEDILYLTEYYLNHFNLLSNKSITNISPDVATFFRQYLWPGNIRELKNVVEYLINIVDENTIYMNHLPDYLQDMNKKTDIIPVLNNYNLPKLNFTDSLNSEITLPKQIAQLEKKIITHTYIKYRYNISKTATALGITRKTLYKKLKKYNIDV